MSDDAFEPRLGRMRAKGAKRTSIYLAQVVTAAKRAGGPKRGAGAPFSGRRIGRGASLGRVLASRDRHTGFRQRRAVVKARLVKLVGKGLGPARTHLHYLQRDGVTREGEPGRLYAANEDQADGKAFVGRCDGDRHQFRFIVSVEDADQYDDLKPFVRRLMAQMEGDLGTQLDWVAVDHFNTGHPHTHIVLRGKDDRDEDLIIARDYISGGLRERAIQLATLDLGPRTDLEIEQRLRHDVGEERLTAIDRRLVRDMDVDRIVLAASRDPFQQALRAGRLQKLGSLGLAEDLGAGRWRLADGLEDALRRMGERGDIIRTIQRALTARKFDRPWADRVIHEPGAPPVVGRIVLRGLEDELADRHYLIVDGVDGRSHYVGIGKGEGVAPIPEGGIVRVTARTAGVRPVDRTIVAVAAAHNGRYDVDAHLHYDPHASEAFAETHVRRLEAMRRTMHSIERAPDGRWSITPDHLDKAAAFEARQLRDRPVTVEILSAMPLEQLIDADAATWLDRELVAKAPEPLRDAGFGQEALTAQGARRQWLVGQGLAQQRDGRTLYRANLLETLQRRELQRVGGQLSAERGVPFAEARAGERIEGRFARAVEMASGRHALIERSRDFTLVPWRPVLERHVGKSVSGILRGDGISWTIGRQRSGPSLS